MLPLCRRSMLFETFVADCAFRPAFTVSRWQKKEDEAENDEEEEEEDERALQVHGDTRVRKFLPAKE